MSRRTQKNVGIIGLGIIGRRVADCLRRQRFATFVWNRTPRAYPNFVGSPAEVAELCDFIQIFVSNDDALMEVVQAMKQSLGAHHVVVAHSTVAPGTMRAVAEVVQRRGAQLLDAPFTGSKMAAEKGELVYYVGGDEAAFRRARPVLEASSKEIVEIGEIGQATTIKVATNMVTAAIVQSSAEALALVHGAGVPLEKFADAMAENGSNSGTLAMKLPKMMSGDFEPHFSVKHMLKDVEIATRMARSNGLRLPATEVARESLIEQMREGHADEDYSAIARSFFPDGPPRKTAAPAPIEEEDEEQDDLSAWAERTPREVRIEEEKPAVAEPAPEPEAVARNGHSEEARETSRVETNGADEPELKAEVADEVAEEEVREEEIREEQPVEVAEEKAGSEAEPVSSEAEESEAEEVDAPAEIQAADEDKDEDDHEEKQEQEHEEVEEKERPRGFFSRLFSKTADY